MTAKELRDKLHEFVEHARQDGELDVMDVMCEDSGVPAPTMFLQDGDGDRHEITVTTL